MGKFSAWLLVFALLAALAIGGLASGHAADWWLASDAAREAYARRLAAQASLAEASAARAWVEVETDRAAAGAVTASKQFTALGLSAATVLFAVGGALAGALWLNKRAITIYPNRAGQWPVIVQRGRGWIAIHDPNRALGPATVYHGERRPGPMVRFALPTDVATMAQVAGQAQAVSLVAAASQAEGPISSQTRQLVEAVSRPRVSAPLPEVRPSAWEPSHVERLLAAAGDSE